MERVCWGRQTRCEWDGRMQGLGKRPMAAMAEQAVCASKDAQEAGGVKLRKPALKLMIALTAALALAACESAPTKKRSSEYFPESKYGVKASPRVVADGKPVPKGGGRAIVGKPYKVAGRWYHPKEEPGYTKVGFASWYGEAFHGRKTANGEIYDRHSLTAAHTTMPLPSYARVTNVENGRSMIVRVNDRGPFHGNREIDLSQRVAKMLGTKQAGIGKVKVEYIGPARMDGNDEAFLMASYDGPGAVTPGGTMPGTMLAQAPAAPAPAAGPVRAPAASVMVASAEPLAQGAGSTNYVPSFAPRPRPLTLPQPVTVASTSGTTHPQLDPSYMIAFDPAVAYESAAQIMVASASPAASAVNASAAAAEAQAIMSPAAATATEVPAAAPAVQTLGEQPQTLGTIRVPAASPVNAAPAAYQDPSAAGQPQMIWQPGLNAPRNLLRGGAVSSYAANDRINGVFGAFETFENSATSLQKLNR